jgi:hypothetical protein
MPVAPGAVKLPGCFEAARLGVLLGLALALVAFVGWLAG